LIDAEQYTPLVHKITWGIYRKFYFKYDYEELFQEGYVGLMKAIKDFDESKGYKFITYAHFRIKASILNFMRDDGWYIARTAHERNRKSYPPETLDICLTDRGTTLKERLPYEEKGYNNVDLRIILHNLPLKLRKILVLRYIKGLKIKEVEKILGISHATIINRQKEGLERLRKELET
jgi:RNA polymerase sporulation-specific sigma factor